MVSFENVLLRSASFDIRLKLNALFVTDYLIESTFSA